MNREKFVWDSTIAYRSYEIMAKFGWICRLLRVPWLKECNTCVQVCVTNLLSNLRTVAARIASSEVSAFCMFAYLLITVVKTGKTARDIVELFTNWHSSTRCYGVSISNTLDKFRLYYPKRKFYLSYLLLNLSAFQRVISINVLGGST